MKKNSKEVDMLHGPLTSQLLLFAAPIAASSMLQQLFNSSDTAVVGRFADANALAAVGTNGEIVALLVSLSAGLAVGANVLLARLIGSGERSEISHAIHTALVLAFLMGVGGLLFGQCIAKPLLVMIDTPEQVLKQAVSYLKIYFLGYPGLLIYDFGAAILRARGDSRRPFLVLIFTGVLNVLLNLFFVIICGLDVAGVGLATGLATAAAAVVVLWMLTKEEQDFRLEWKKLRLNRKDAAQILRIGIPAALQGAVFCLANIVVQAAVNGFGTETTAGNAISMNFEYFAYYVITAMGQAATTFTSQNYAAGQEKRCKKILGICLLYGTLLCAVLSVPLTIWGRVGCGFFSTDEKVIALAIQRMWIILLPEFICAFYEIPAGALRGRGHSALPAVWTILGTCVFRILWVETVFRRVGTLQSLFVVFPINWVVTALLMWGTYFWVMRRKKS